MNLRAPIHSTQPYQLNISRHINPAGYTYPSLYLPRTSLQTTLFQTTTKQSAHLQITDIIWHTISTSSKNSQHSHNRSEMTCNSSSTNMYIYQQLPMHWTCALCLYQGNVRGNDDTCQQCGEPKQELQE